MGNRGTAPEAVISGAYIEFQAAVLRALPRDIPDDLLINWPRHGEDLALGLRKLLLPPEEQQSVAKPAPSAILRRLFEGEEIVVGATDGTKTLAQAKDVFTGYLDPDFENWGTDKAGQATKPTTAVVYELRKDATFGQMFGSLGDLNTLVWEQSQIVKFCQQHRKKLRQDGHGTFFLFMVGDGPFVAFVNVDAGELKAYVYRAVIGNVWYADNRYRVVVPATEKL